MSEESADATAAAVRRDPAREARKAFYDWFDKHCTTRLSRAAERKLATIFEQTIGHAIYMGHHQWGTDSEIEGWLLGGVRDIAVGAHDNSSGEVSLAVLTQYADQVVDRLSNECKIPKAKPNKFRPGVFCEVYESSSGSAPVLDAASLEAAEATAQMVERARADFMKHAHRAVEPATLSPAAKAYLRDTLFVRTVQHAIETYGLDWDNERRRPRYALRRLGEIAEMAAFAGDGETVEEDALHQAALHVICTWRLICKELAPRFVFCENFTAVYDCPDPPTPLARRGD